MKHFNVYPTLFQYMRISFTYFYFGNNILEEKKMIKKKKPKAKHNWV